MSKDYSSTQEKQIMALREALSQCVGFPVPDAFAQVMSKFVDRAGNLEAGLNLLATYVGVTNPIVNATENRDETTPIEFFPFLDTGGDGEKYGYVIHSPELSLHDYPMGSFIPGGSEGVVYIGNATRDALENLISYAHHATGFVEVDLEWLRSFAIHPEPVKTARVRPLLDARYVRPMPSLPADWIHLMTHDGVGSAAHVSQFRPGNVQTWSATDSLENFLLQADRDAKEGFAGTALYYLKEAWWLHYFTAQRQGKLKDLKAQLIEVYRTLGKALLARTMEMCFAWIS